MDTRRNLVLLIAPVIIGFCSQAQETAFHFKYLTSTEGLSDGLVRAITQDKYGFIWFGTNYGLNRFDGISIKTFYLKANDSSSISNNYTQSLYTDKKGELWVGTMTGLCKFDYSTQRFIRYNADVPVIAFDIRQDIKGRTWVGSRTGLWVLDEKQKKLVEYAGKGNTEHNKKYNFYVNQIVDAPENKWYLATTVGIRLFDPITGEISEIRHNPKDSNTISSDWIFSLSMDTGGNLWVACGREKAVLEKINVKTGSIKHYYDFQDPQKKWATNVIQRVLSDRDGKIWAISSYSGISLFNKEKESFEHFTANDRLPNDILNNTNISMYQDRQGLIWLGSGGYGVSYFYPGGKLFSSIYLPMKEDLRMSETWCRAACEDELGNLWLGTSRGVFKYNRDKKSFTNIFNIDDKPPVLHTNSIRAMAYDKSGDIWIGTAKGLNRYNPATGNTKFYSVEQGIPNAFFWMIEKDRKDTYWMGTASGLFRYDRTRDRFDNLVNDSLLKPYARKNVQSLFVDRHNRLWIGLMDIGLVMYDIDKGTTRLLTIKDSLITDTRFSAMAEDNDGIIWIGSEYQLVAYDPRSNRSRFYSMANGLSSDRTNNILVDSLNRVWIGTSNGLSMLNAARNYIKKFDVNDGLLTNQFNEQAALKTRDGYFVYPTYKGYSVFRPEDYRESNQGAPVYLTSFRVLDKPIVQTPEELRELNLKHNQNFFSLVLSGLNFMNPNSCTYAYKLEPFNKDWIYSKNREVSYTNVPPGDYVFRYKVLGDNPGAAVPEKTLTISISQSFHKTWWFRTIIGLLLLAGILGFYRYRVRQREKIHILQGKAQRLEKEKTLVMYESLKQHLNPHFLFNSLTSLRSLIRTDTKTATNFLDGMSKVYRYVLKSGEQELMSLKDELDFVKTYTELQQTRFNEGLKVNISVDENSYHKNIVPVTLQNLVENAIKHNTADKDSPLVIDIFTKNGAVVVRNNLQRYRLVESSNNRGLANLRSLYLFYSDSPVEVAEDAKHFTVTIPLL